MQCQESWHHSCAMTCAEVIQLAQAQPEKMTQQEGNRKLPVKSELSWPADSSVSISTNLSGQLLFKHMQEQGRTSASIIIFFPPKKYFSIRISLQNTQRLRSSSGVYKTQGTKCVGMAGAGALTWSGAVCGCCQGCCWCDRLWERFCHLAAALVCEPFSGGTWTVTCTQKKHSKLCLLVLISKLLLQGNCASPNANTPPYFKHLFYTNMVHLGI